MRAGVLMNGWRPALAAISLVMLPGELVAQSSFRFTPSLNVALVSDSNLFARAGDHQSDVISRTSPALDAEYRSRLLTFRGRYIIDAERFARNTSLTTLQARQYGGVSLSYHTRRVTIGGETSWTTTEMPGELNLLSGVTLARGRGRRVAMSPTMTYRVNARIEGSVKYEFEGDRLAGGSDQAFHAVSATGERRVSRRDAARLSYIFRNFDSGLNRVSRAHVFTGGWTRQLTRQATVSLGAGPRLGDGTTAAEVSASLGYRRPGTELSIGYARLQTTLIGLDGAATTDGITAAVIRGRPEALQFRIAPAIMQTSRTSLHARVYRLSVGASRPVGRTMIVEAAYDWTQQRGDVYVSRIGQTIARHVLLFNLFLTRSRGVSP